MNNYEKEYYEWDQFWDNGSLQDKFNSIRIAETIKLIPSDVESLADVGCGNGVFLNALMLKRPELNLIGIDRSSTALKFLNTNKIEGSITALPFDDSSFDCVSSLEVLEHLAVDDYETALSELARITKKYLLVSVPFQEKLEDNFTKCPNCLSRFNRDLHLRNFSTKQFKSLFDHLGFSNVVTHTTGKIRTYLYHSQYRRIFLTEEFFKWDVPICPFCGFRKEISGPEKEPTNGAATMHFISRIATIPKLLWPKTSRDFWIVGLFVRKDLKAP